MKIEDAFLYLVLDLDTLSLESVPDMCKDAVAAGVDAVQLRGVDATRRDTVEAVAAVCRQEEALLILANDAELAGELGLDGVHLDDAEGALGVARLSIGEEGLVGVTTRSLDKARLAVAVGADYLVHEVGLQCRADFAGIGPAAGIPLFAGGIGGLAEARSMVELGLYRLCINGAVLELDGDLTSQVGEFSLLLGRC